MLHAEHICSRKQTVIKAASFNGGIKRGKLFLWLKSVNFRWTNYGSLMIEENIFQKLSTGNNKTATLPSNSAFMPVGRNVHKYFGLGKNVLLL